ncbi:MAG: hypothetical protein JO320_03290 [Alphaproteobacteria bacterium]|nr:hypothetical protein [Alphaproteobacteria bacterium]MBV9374078.1 hypothetical protein [Alphaproteobacteria bacterium]
MSEVLGSTTEAVRRLEARGIAPRRARRLLVEGLKSGEVAAFFVRPFDHKRKRADPGKLTDELIDVGDEPSASVALMLEPDTIGGGTSMVILRPQLEVNLLDVDRLAERLCGRTTDETPKNRGGRPAAHNWDAALAQAVTRIWQYDLPKHRDDLSGELLDWFERTSPKPPERRTIEKKVAGWWALLQLIAAAHCELRPSDSSRGGT